MSEEAHAREEHHSAGPRPRRPRRAWAVATPLVLLLSGGLFVVSAVNSEGTDLRPGRYTSMSSLVESETRRVEKLQKQVTRLQREVDRLSESSPDQDVSRLQKQATKSQEAAGLTQKRGEGLRIVLSDAPSDVIDDYVAEDPDNHNPNTLLVHQQDIQGVVNALWRGGAEAVTIEGQRVITTTGIKCTGSTVQLHGVPYPAPYEIEAIGDVDALTAALESDSWVAGYRRLADTEEGLGWEMETRDEIVAPAYEGVPQMRYAEAL